ncbi:MAG: outer membrane beta-barrel protein [Planctomycetaceae bacterium]|nr:outer membrane beta-barrel protein [Planctomycetaceae bacterium]
MVYVCLVILGWGKFLSLSDSQILFADEIESDDRNSSTLLANPMEKYFNQSLTNSPNYAVTDNVDSLGNSNPFNVQAPPNLQQDSNAAEQNPNYNFYGNYPDNNSNNPEFYSYQNQFQTPPNYALPNNSNQFQTNQPAQFYPQYYPQYAPQYAPQYYPQYSPQYYPYSNGTFSPFGYGQVYGDNYNPYNYNYYDNGNYYGYSPNSAGNSVAPQPDNIRRSELLEPEAVREMERLSRREAAEAARLEAEWTPKPPQPILYPILTKIWACVTTLSPFNSPTGPDRGVGMPLRNGSWLDRPYYFGAFIGNMRGSELVSNMIDQSKGANGGLVLGYNMNEYWGLEGRLHFASIDIRETQNGAAQYALWYAARNPGLTVYVPGLTTRSNQLTVIDISVHYYPLGNARFRPYFKYGLGFTRESFYDTFGQKRTAETLSMPFGIGLRYWWNKQFAIHADIVDNVIFSHDIVRTQANWSFCIGLTYSFGSNNKRRPIVHWPYTPSSGSRR